VRRPSPLPSALLVVLGLAGCAEEMPREYRDLPPRSGLLADPARLPRGPAAAGELALARILVAWEGSHPARPVRWTLDEARRRAAALTELARAPDADFGSLARRFSDDAETSASGGDMGVVSPWALHPDIAAAAQPLALGQVSEPVETPEGFSILFRREPSWAQAAEIVVSFDGAVRYVPRQPRDREAARALAEDIRRRVLDGAAMEEEALRHSDAPEREHGGITPPFARGTRHPEFEAVVWRLSPGELSEVIETPTGFHLVRRMPIERVQVRRIEVFFSDGNADPAARRTREEARARIEEARRRALLPDADFAALAAEFSDGAEASKGGMMDPFARGVHPLPLERAAFQLSAGQVSGVMELPGEFIIIKRVP